MLESATAIIVYFGVFAIYGYRRGPLREILTFGVSLLALVSLIWYYHGTRHLPSSWSTLAAGLELSRANLAVVSQSWSAMVIWMLACLGTYWFGLNFPQTATPVSLRLTGAAFAIGNGLIYWLLLIPWLNDHITLELDRDWRAMLNSVQLYPLPLTEAARQTQNWLSIVQQYLPTMLVILGISILIYFMSRMRRPKLHRHSRIR